jgi:hypothetical protein
VISPSQDEKLLKLGETVAQPPPVAVGHADHRRGHRDELVGLKLDERCGLGLANAGRHEEQRRGDAEHRGEASEHGGTWLLDPARLELRDRRARDTDAARQLRLSEVQPLARGSNRQRQGRP